MTNSAELSEGYPRDWRFYCPPRNGKIVCPSLLRRQFKSKPVPYEYLCLSTISVLTFTKQLCFILGVPEKAAKPDVQGYTRNRSPIFTKIKRQPLLLAIDEAQYLNTES